jgi:hypothetical protein
MFTSGSFSIFAGAAFVHLTGVVIRRNMDRAVDDEEIAVEFGPKPMCDPSFRIEECRVERRVLMEREPTPRPAGR